MSILDEVDRPTSTSGGQMYEVTDPYRNAVAKEENDLKYYAKRKLVVNWNDEDQSAIDEIKEFASTVYFAMFDTTLTLLDEIAEKTNSGKNWALLTTKDLEGYAFSLGQEKIQTALGVNNAKMDALFAKYSLEDDYHASYLAGSGTNPLREAKAHTETEEKRYSYFFRYYIYVMCEALGREIDGLTKSINSALFRRGSNA